MARRAFKLASFATIAASTTGFYLNYNKHLDPNDFGVVRVGRAVATVSFTACEKEGQISF